MLNDITIGQYYPTGSIIHRLDPRVKIFVTFLYMILLFMVKSFIGFLGMFLLLVIPVVLSKVPVSYLLKGLKGLIIIILFTVCLNMFMTPGTVLYKIGFLKITDNGLRNAVLMAVRLILLVTGTSLLTLVTSPISLTDGMERLMKKVPLVKNYAHELAMMMSIALRFIPTLMEETTRIINAQKSRGADFESGNIISRAKAFITVLIPLFLSAFQRAEDLALAMEARCYRGGENRTRMKELKYSKADSYAYMYGALMLIFTIATNILHSKGIL